VYKARTFSGLSLRADEETFSGIRLNYLTCLDSSGIARRGLLKKTILAKPYSK